MIPPPFDQTASTLLAIETAGSSCSAAVARGGTVLAAECRLLRHGHGEALFPMIERVMREAGLSPSQLDAIAATIGPGGFTGIRVGLAAAHGMALAVGARLIGVTSFAAVAAGLNAIGGPGYERLLVALDSRRADLYVQLFAPDAPTLNLPHPHPNLPPLAGEGAVGALAGEGRVGTGRAREGWGVAPLGAAQAVLPDRLADYVAELAGGAPLLIAGDAAEAAAALLDRRAEIAIADHSAPDARGVVAAALGQLRCAAAPGPVRPFYLRAPDVTLPTRRPPVPASSS